MIRKQLDLFETKYDVINQKVDDTFWAYHAGMADGDGCFYEISDTRPYYSLGLIDKNIIKEISDLYGVKLCVEKRSKGHKKFYRSSLSGKNVRHFYSKVAPYLIEKNKKVKELCRKHKKMQKK